MGIAEKVLKVAGSEVKVIHVQACECCNGGGIHFNGVASLKGNESLTDATTQVSVFLKRHTSEVTERCVHASWKEVSLQLSPEQFIGDAWIALLDQKSSTSEVRQLQ